MRLLKSLLTALLAGLAAGTVIGYSSAGEASSGSPKVLLFSAIDHRFAGDTMEHWGRRVGISGFILSYVAEWWMTREQMLGQVGPLAAFQKQGEAFGVDSNFIKIALGYRVLPAWGDDAAWQIVAENFRAAGELVRLIGFKGVAIDTEAYGTDLFDSTSPRFKGVGRGDLRKQIRARGRQIMEALTSSFREIEVILLPEGALYWFNKEYANGRHYELWIDFYDGLASVRNPKGIVIAAEDTYNVTRPADVQSLYDRIDRTMRAHAADLAFWVERCSISIGIWPLGKAYDDKTSKYPPRAFESQLKKAIALSPRYVWIYDHGVAWSRMTPEQVVHYTAAGRWIWGKDYQTLPTDPDLNSYYNVVRHASRRAN